MSDQTQNCSDKCELVGKCVMSDCYFKHCVCVYMACIRVCMCVSLDLLEIYTYKLHILIVCEFVIPGAHN